MKDNKITIMFPTNFMGIGGAEQQLLELVRGIDKARFEPLVVTLYPNGSLEPEIRQIPGVESFSVNRKGKLDFSVIKKILSLLRQKRVDIIQPFLTPATFFGLVSAAIHRTPVKVVTERSGAGLPAHLGYKLYQKVEDFLTRYADWVVPNSEAGKSFLMDRGINPERIRVIYNGLNLERLVPDQTKVARIREQMELPQDGIVVGMTANLNPAKDYATFLEGAMTVHQAVPQTRFAILGDGPLRPSVEAMARTLGVAPFVTFFGHQRDIASYIASFDIACLCSNYVEGCSNATIETMALGKPVVVSDVGGNREVVDHGSTGLLVPVRDPQALAEGVLTLTRQPGFAQEIGQRGREMVHTKFSLARMVHDYEQLYEQAIRLKRKKIFKQAA
jgi:glycosyltransferase involved in cell wall biosynthesis